MDRLPFETPGEGRGQPQGAVPVLAPAGSCLLFDRRIYHAATPNWSSTDRSVIFMGYGYRWLKARDAMFVEPTMAQTSCPIVRQLLGYSTQNAGLYHGNGLDVPLRQWLRDRGVDGFGLGSDGPGGGHKPMSRSDGDVGHATLPRSKSC